VTLEMGDLFAIIHSQGLRVIWVSVCARVRQSRGCDVTVCVSRSQVGSTVRKKDTLHFSLSLSLLLRQLLFSLFSFFCNVSVHSHIRPRISIFFFTLSIVPTHERLTYRNVYERTCH